MKKEEKGKEVSRKEVETEENEILEKEIYLIGSIIPMLHPRGGVLHFGICLLKRIATLMDLKKLTGNRGERGM